MLEHRNVFLKCNFQSLKGQTFINSLNASLLVYVVTILNHKRSTRLNPSQSIKIIIIIMTIHKYMYGHLSFNITEHLAAIRNTRMYLTMNDRLMFYNALNITVITNRSFVLYPTNQFYACVSFFIKLSNYSINPPYIM